MEVDSDTHNLLMTNERVNIGWSICKIFNYFGIVRCYGCCRYGHMQKDCRDKKTCPKCAEEHDLKDCKSVMFKCRNCDNSNKKLGLSLDINHVCWDVNKCSSYRRMEQIQKKKFQK